MPAASATSAASPMLDIAGQAVGMGDTVAIAEADYDLPPAQRLVTVQHLREVTPAGNAAPYWVVEYTHAGYTRTASSGQIVRVAPVDATLAVRAEDAVTVLRRAVRTAVRMIGEVEGDRKADKAAVHLISHIDSLLIDALCKVGV